MGRELESRLAKMGVRGLNADDMLNVAQKMGDKTAVTLVTRLKLIEAQHKSKQKNAQCLAHSAK
jgi:hypothetical protein